MRCQIGVYQTQNYALANFGGIIELDVVLPSGTTVTDLKLFAIHARRRYANYIPFTTGNYLSYPMTTGQSSKQNTYVWCGRRNLTESYYTSGCVDDICICNAGSDMIPAGTVITVKLKNQLPYGYAEYSRFFNEPSGVATISDARMGQYLLFDEVQKNGFVKMSYIDDGSERTATGTSIKNGTSLEGMSISHGIKNVEIDLQALYGSNYLNWYTKVVKSVGATGTSYGGNDMWGMYAPIGLTA